MLQTDVQIQEQRDLLLNHVLFKQIQTLDQMRFFMETHIFAVWDFMSLLKTLQIRLTSPKAPWTPPVNRDAARFINEIVLDEESDDVGSGRYMSHFELYLEAMRESGARTDAIDKFLETLAASGDVPNALTAARAPEHVRSFVLSTMNFCTQDTHEVAAAFLYGREDIIPDMFARILARTQAAHDPVFSQLKIYLERHITVDGESHRPMAAKLMDSLCGHEETKWKEAKSVAVLALQARRRLWDGTLN